MKNTRCSPNIFPICLNSNAGPKWSCLGQYNKTYLLNGLCELSQINRLFKLIVSILKNLTCLIKLVVFRFDH